MTIEKIARTLYATKYEVNWNSVPKPEREKWLGYAKAIRQHFLEQLPQKNKGTYLESYGMGVKDGFNKCLKQIEDKLNDKN